MGGTSTAQQQNTQQSQLTPWAPAGNALQGILGQLPSNIGATPQISSALDQLSGIAGQGNPFGANATNAANSQLGGGANYGAANNTLTGAYGDLQHNLSPYTSGNAMDPSSNPALASQLATVNSDVMNSVNPMFAAAGRLGSPDNYQAVARGITQGSAPILQNAASNQLGAANSLYGAGAGTAGGLSALDAARAGIQSQGIGNAAGAYGTQTLPAMLGLNTAMTGQQLPIQNAGARAGILGPLAAQFGQQTGSGTQSGSQTMSGAQQFATLAGGFNSLFGGGSGGGGGSLPNAAKWLFG